MKGLGFRCSGVILILLTAIYFLLTPALAHVPVFGEGGKSYETAIFIENPAKSRVLYGQLAAGDLRYYSFEMKQGDRIVLGLTVPVEQGNQGFNPDLILMGPGIANEGKVPETPEVPNGYGVKVFPGDLPESPVYEAFTPSAFYSLASPDLKAPENGTYYAVVSSTQGKGNYGIVIGYGETFTLKEWISVTLNQIKIYLWEGQSLFLIFIPLGNSCIRSLGNRLQKGSCIRFQSCSYLRNLRRPFLPGHRIIVHFPDAYFIEQKFIFFRRFCYSLPNSGECSTWNYCADFKS